MPAPGCKREGAACSQLGAGAGGVSEWAALGVRGESVEVGGARRSFTGVSQDLCVLACRTRLTGGTRAGGVWRSESGDGGSGIDSATGSWFMFLTIPCF